MPVDYQPCGNRLLCEMVQDKSSKIIMPDNAQQPAARFTVVAVGPGITADSGTHIPVPFAVGDEIIFNTKQCLPLVPIERFGGRKLVLVDADDVLLKVNRAPDRLDA